MPLMEDYGYMLLGTKHKTRRQERLQLGASFIAGIVLFWLGWAIWQKKKGTVLPPALGIYQHLNDAPILHSPATLGTVGPDERAVVTSMYTDSYAYAIATLGYSLRKANTTAKRVVIYAPNRISKRALCVVQSAGWDLHAVDMISPPHGGKGVNPMFYDQFTKLSTWKLDQIGIKTVIYLDADTLVRKNFDELWDLPFEFGAVPDVFLGETGFTIGFNAGVLVLHTSTTVFEHMISKVETATFSLRDAEQSFLNMYYGVEAVRLPYVYNGNLALKGQSKLLWDGMQSDMRIIHYTLHKPFDNRPWCGYLSSCSTELVYDIDRHRQFIEKAKKEDGGLFSVEMGWWEEDYNSMMGELGNKCP